MVVSVAHPSAGYENFAFPFRFDPSTGDFATVAQDSEDDVMQSVEVLLSTRRGERIEVSGYGISDPTFLNEVDSAEIEQAVAEWEPRALALVQQALDPGDELARIVTVRVAQRSSTP